MKNCMQHVTLLAMLLCGAYLGAADPEIIIDLTAEPDPTEPALLSAVAKAAFTDPETSILQTPYLYDLVTHASWDMVKIAKPLYRELCSGALHRCEQIKSNDLMPKNAKGFATRNLKDIKRMRYEPTENPFIVKIPEKNLMLLLQHTYGYERRADEYTVWASFTDKGIDRVTITSLSIIRKYQAYEQPHQLTIIAPSPPQPKTQEKTQRKEYFMEDHYEDD